MDQTKHEHERFITSGRTHQALPAPLESYKARPNHIGDPRSINKLEYCDEVFQRLALTPEIMRVVDALSAAHHPTPPPALRGWLA